MKIFAFRKLIYELLYLKKIKKHKNIGIFNLAQNLLCKKWTIKIDKSSKNNWISAFRIDIGLEMLNKV